MPTIAIRLDPRQLGDPDADLRYRLPELLAARSSGLIADDGYDYAGDPPFLVLFLNTQDLKRALACVLDVVENTPVLNNDLRSAVVAIQHDGAKYEVVYPRPFEEEFLPK